MDDLKIFPLWKDLALKFYDLAQVDPDYIITDNELAAHCDLDMRFHEFNLAKLQFSQYLENEKLMILMRVQLPDGRKGFRRATEQEKTRERTDRVQRSMLGKIAKEALILSTIDATALGEEDRTIYERKMVRNAMISTQAAMMRDLGNIDPSLPIKPDRQKIVQWIEDSSEE